MKRSTYFYLSILLMLTTSCREDLCEKGLFLFCENDTSTPTPGQLTKKTTGPDNLDLVSFSVGNKGYTGTGGVGFPPTSGGSKEFQVYDPATDTWQKIASLPGEGRMGAFGFGTTMRGYVGGGFNYRNITDPEGSVETITVSLDDFYAYDPQSDTWEQKADLPGGKGRYAAFGIGNRGYVLKENKLWEYDPAQNQWTPKAYCPVPSGLTFAIGFRGYVLHNQKLWEYNALTDRWNAKADLPNNIASGGISFATANRGYIVGKEQIWEYNPVNNTWFRKIDTPDIAEGNENGVSLDLEDGFSINDKGYFGIYYRSFAESLYEFDPNK